FAYVGVTNAIQVVSSALNAVVATVNLSENARGIAITPDGSRVYVTAGDVIVIDTATNSITSTFRAEAAPSTTVISNAMAVAISPDGTRAYVTNFLGFNGFQFNFGGNVVALDTSNNRFIKGVDLFNYVPGPIAIAPDGSRAYVGIQSEWVNTGYGAGFLPAA